MAERIRGLTFRAPGRWLLAVVAAASALAATSTLSCRHHAAKGGYRDGCADQHDQAGLRPASKPEAWAAFFEAPRLGCAGGVLGDECKSGALR